MYWRDFKTSALKALFCIQKLNDACLKETKKKVYRLTNDVLLKKDNLKNINFVSLDKRVSFKKVSRLTNTLRYVLGKSSVPMQLTVLIQTCLGVKGYRRIIPGQRIGL